MGSAEIRVLEVFEPPEGGVPEHVRLLAEELATRGHDVTVAARPDAAPRSALERVGIDFVPLELTGGVPDPIADFRGHRALSALLRARPFDVIHAHGQKAGLLARRVASRHGVPSVYTPHSFVYRTQKLRPRATARLRFHVGLAAERRLGRRTDAIVAVAEEERRSAIADRIAPPERLVVVHPGVSPDTTATPDAQLLDFRGDGPLFGFIAGLREQKGLSTLLAALELLAKRGQAVRFAIVGNGPLRAEVAMRLKSAGLAKNTLLVPFEGRVEPYLRALDCFVLPSLWEGLPMAILEAMAMGLPTVASAVNGTPEAVEDGVTGYLVPPSAPEPLGDRLHAMATDPQRRAQMGLAAQRVAHDRFGVDRMVDELASVYSAVHMGEIPHTG